MGAGLVLGCSSTFSKMTDEQIVSLAQTGDMSAIEYLINKYRRMVRGKSGKYFIFGAERADTIQEGTIGLLEAIRGFRADTPSSFRTFADLCVECQLKSAVKKKGDRLNASAITTDERDEFASDRRINDPIYLTIAQESTDEIARLIRNNCSSFECRVVGLFITGQSYGEIANVLGCNEKSVDNALSRVRRKIAPLIDLGHY